MIFHPPPNIPGKSPPYLDNVQPTHQFSLDVELRVCRPVGELLEPLTNLLIAQNVERSKLYPNQRLHNHDNLFKVVSGTVTHLLSCKMPHIVLLKPQRGSCTNLLESTRSTQFATLNLVGGHTCGFPFMNNMTFCWLMMAFNLSRYVCSSRHVIVISQ